MKVNRHFAVGIFFGLLTFVAVTAIGLGLLHCFDWLYRFDVSFLKIPQYSLYDKGEILENYHAVMAYLSPFSTGDFALPTMEFSQNGAYHFYEVKRIFFYVYLLGFFSIIGMVMILVKVKNKLFLRVSAWTTLALPAILFTVMALDFNAAFILFHKLFFNNDYWIFDSITDPIITILPQTFFLHCAVFIGIMWVFAAILQVAVWWRLCSKNRALDRA